MFSKIQKYLLLNYPLLWNLKIVPMTAIIIVFNLLFFILGFISGKIDFQETYKSYSNDSLYILSCILTSILVFIIWLINYLKNNAFKSFYPKKSISLYTEWIILFFLISGNSFYVFSYLQGVNIRERSYSSKKEITKTLDLLKKTEILMPKENFYYYKSPTSNLHETSKKNDTTELSLLNYTDNFYYNNTHNKKQNIIINWLKEGEKDSIKRVISEYLLLQKKHNLKTNLNESIWFKIIYNPPYFPVSNSNVISTYKESYNSKYYTEYDKLYHNYNTIYDAYFNSGFTETVILVTIYISLIISVSLFSFRITSGKSWLISIIISGIILFTFGIFTIISLLISDDNNGNFYFNIFYWSLLFFCIITYLFFKVYNKKTKGYSLVILNIGIWLFPNLMLIYYWNYMTFNERYTDLYNPIYNYFVNNPSVFYWINLIFVTLGFYIFSIFIKKWKSLPEE